MERVDLHVHIILDGIDARPAIAKHKEKPQDDLIRANLKAYQDVGATYLRDGGDPCGVCIRAKELAPEYGITYRMPSFPIHKNGHYGSFIGFGWDTIDDYKALVDRAIGLGADFIKIMISGLMNFNRAGTLSEESLTDEEIRTLIGIAHDKGFSVMAHANGSRAIITAVEAGVDTIEHGGFLNEEAICALSESDTVWVPTLASAWDPIGRGAFSDDDLRKIHEMNSANVALEAKKGALIACGSDAAAVGMRHGEGTIHEEELLREAIGEGADAILEKGFETVRAKF